MSRSKQILNRFFGNMEDSRLEDQIPVILTFISAVLSVVAVTVNTFIGLSLMAIMIPAVAAVVNAGLYLMCRHSGKLFLSKVLTAVFTFIYFDSLWIFNYGSQGPILYIFLIFFVFLLIVFDRPARDLFAIIYVLNILGMFLLEYYMPGLLGDYPDRETGLYDTYISYFMYLFFTAVMTSIIRYHYRQEQQKARRSEQLKAAFLSNMSHEIRTPMNAILGFSRLLEHAENDRERAEYVKILNDNGIMLMQLMDDIIDISKMDAGQYEISLSEFRIEPLFQDLQKMFELYLKEQGRHSVTISHNLPAGNIVLLSDPVRVKQVLYNLLTNSAKYTIHGQIEFGAEVKGKDIEFFVRDSGVGIKTEHHPHIFSRFFKIEDKEYSTLLRGAGIGLSISKMIIEKLGGRIWMHSEYGKGSIFRFLLHDVITKPEQIEQAPGPAHLPFNKKGKILVTEDDESNLLLIKMMLKKMDISFVVAFNGQEALEKYEKEPGIQLVLMDINLPVMDGNEAMKRLKHINPELPVIALTAHAMRGDKEKALNMGFDSYLTKPVYQEELAECLQKFLK